MRNATGFCVGRNHTMQHQLRVCLRVEETRSVTVDFKEIAEATKPRNRSLSQRLQLVIAQLILAKFVPLSDNGGFEGLAICCADQNKNARFFPTLTLLVIRLRRRPLSLHPFALLDPAYIPTNKTSSMLTCYFNTMPCLATSQRKYLTERSHTSLLESSTSSRCFPAPQLFTDHIPSSDTRCSK